MKEIEKIIIYQGNIELKSEFHSGTIIHSEITDHSLVRNHKGEAVLRSESFAGLIRQALVRQFGYRCKDFCATETSTECDCELCELMGHSFIPPEDKILDPSRFHSSRLKIMIFPFQDKGSRIRHHVGIDRRFNVASAHKKLDVEVLSSGAKAQIMLEVENPSDEEEKALERVFADMQNELLTLGGKGSRGYGLFALSDLTKQIYDFSKKAHALSYLLNQEDGVPHPVPAPEQKPIKHKPLTLGKDQVLSIGEYIKNPGRKWGIRLSFSFDLWFPELFLVNDPLEAALTGSDHVCVLNEGGNPWLPPSSIRGVLRSRAEQIIRTINPKAACDPNSDESSCAASLEKAKKAGNGPTIDQLEEKDTLCLGCQAFGSTFYGSRLRFFGGKYCPNDSHKDEIQHFLAVCRFTGGGKEGAKYDALPLSNVEFKRCRLTISDFEPWHLGLLALVFKDLFQADIRFGFGTRKGYGLATGSFSSDDALISLAFAADKVEPDCYLMNFAGESNGQIRDILNYCVNCARNRIKQYKRDESWIKKIG